MTRFPRLAALALALLTACGTNPPGAPDSGSEPPDAGDGAGPDAAVTGADAAAGCAADTTACGTACCLQGETCVAATSTCQASAAQMQRCYAPASFPATAFASEPSYLVDADGYEYQANDLTDATYRQSISVALWPLSAATPLVGAFDLSKEPFDYSKCERCVLITAGKSATDQKRYLASKGTLTITEVGAKKIVGKLEGLELVEAAIDENTLATTRVSGGCSLTIPVLEFSYAEPAVDDRITRCFLPESFASEQFRDFVYPYEANEDGYFYRAIESPSAAGVPNLTLFVEVYADGTGTFPLAGAETNCAACFHFVLIEAQAPSGAKKTYVSSAGSLVLTELSPTAMVGKLDNVTLVETTISGSTFTPVAGGCSTSIPSLDFSSRDATP